MWSGVTSHLNPKNVSMLMRLVDYLKSQSITALFNSLTSTDGSLELTEVGISSLMDTWLLLRVLEGSGERNRGLYVLKSRGTAHSNQVREFLLTDHGVELADVVTTATGFLTGAARLAQEALEKAHGVAREQETEERERSLTRREQVLEAKIAALRAEFAADCAEQRTLIGQLHDREQALTGDRKDVARARRADSSEGRADAAQDRPRRGTVSS